MRLRRRCCSGRCADSCCPLASGTSRQANLGAELLVAQGPTPHLSPATLAAGVGRARGRTAAIGWGAAGALQPAAGHAAAAALCRASPSQAAPTATRYLQPQALLPARAHREPTTTLEGHRDAATALQPLPTPCPSVSLGMTRPARAM